MEASGLDLWLPADHLTQAEHVDRAVGAMLDAVELAGSLGRLPLSLAFSSEQEPPAPVLNAVTDKALRHGP